MNATPMTAGRQGSVFAEPNGPDIVKERAGRRMQRIDEQPYPIRALTHEYGWLAVEVLLSAGITRARQIEHIITRIRNHDRGSTPVCDQLRTVGRLDDVPTPTGRAEG